MIEHWNGTSWAVVASPNNGPSLNLLYGVACASTSDCRAVGVWSTGSAWQTLTEHYTVPPVQLVSVASRKAHGSAGEYDVDLSGSGIECRSGGANGEYTLVFTFANPLNDVDLATVSSGTGSVSSSAIGADAHQYIVNLTSVTNAQHLEVTLQNVQDTTGAFSAAVQKGFDVLIGDTTGDRAVNSADIAQTKSQSGTAVSSSNFRQDLNADGSVNSADIALAKSKSGTALP